MAIGRVQIDIDDFAAQTKKAMTSESEGYEWFAYFRETLISRGRMENPQPYAVECLLESEGFNASQAINRMKGLVKSELVKQGVSNPTDAAIEQGLLAKYGADYTKLKNAVLIKERIAQMREERSQVNMAATLGIDLTGDAPHREDGDESTIAPAGAVKAGKVSQDAPTRKDGVDMSDARNGAASKSPTSCDTFTADGDIREDSQDIATSGNGSVTESGTSANIYGPRQAKNGDAATREGAKVVDSRESGAIAPTTVSRNLRRVPQTEAPAHGFSGGRTAQGTMSRSPEAAAQSGKAYDQETAKTRDTRDDSRGRNAPPSCSPEDGNPAETAPSHGGSVASLEARQGQARESRRAGGNSVRGVEKVNTPPARSAGPMPENKQAVYDFAAAEGLDTADAYECWHVTVNERGGLTADGKPIKNWKAYVRKWCETRASRRNQ